MAINPQYLSLPNSAAGFTPASAASSWGYGAWTQLSAGLDVDVYISGITFQVINTPALDTTVQQLFEIGIGAIGSEVVAIQIPFSIRADTLVGYFRSDIYTVSLPEPMLTSARTCIAIRVADSLATAITYDGFKIMYQREFRVGQAIPNGQYKSDRLSSVVIGGSTGTDGYTTSLYEEQLVSIDYANIPITPKIENQITGSSFSNIATTTGSEMYVHSNDLPTWRRGAVLTYDSLNKRYITCGGYNGTVRFSDLWALTYDKDNFQARWRKLAPSGTPPVGKNLGAAVQLNKNGKSWFVYWGGSTGSDVQDMLIADCTTVNAETWTTVTQTNAPAIRSYITHHMVEVSTGVNTYDVYLFGGWGNTRLNDLMKCSFDLSGSVPTAITWTTVKANGAVGNPTIRSGTIMVYDSLNNRLVLFGGYTGSSYLADLWSFNISTSTWTQLSPSGTAPAGRELPNGAYDVVNQRMVVFAGWAGALTNNMNDIISISLVSGSESFTTIRANDLTNSGFAPFSSGAACLDYDKRLIVEFGQNGYDGTDKYVYAFDLDEGRTSDATMYGLNIVNTFMARDAPSSCVDTARNCGMLICGFSTMNDNTTTATGDHMNEVWSYDPTENRLRYLNSGSLGIGFREGAMACYDSVNDRILVFGGLTLTSRVCNELWELKPDTYGNYKARRMLPTGVLPDSRWLGVIAFDAVRNRVIIWGGASNNNVLLASDSMFILDLSGGGDGVWSKATPTGTPHGVNWHPMFSYKASNNRLYIYSGASDSASSVFYTDTCYIDLTNVNPAWVSLPSTTSTVGVWGGTMAYDATNNYLVAFGGGLSGSVINTLSFLNLASDTNSWATVVAKGVAPAARRSTASWFLNGKFYVTSGRPTTGKWFSDVQELTPNYATPANSSWSDKVPIDYQPVQTTTSGLVNNSNYRWQSWVTVGGFDTIKSSFGDNLESVADFIVGSLGGLAGVKIWDGFSWVYKPLKVWTGSGWSQKPVKVWTGSGWVEKP